MASPDESASKKRIFRPGALVPWGLLFVVWVILSGKFDPFHLGMGVLTLFGVAWLQRGLAPLSKPENPPLRLERVLGYGLWLFKEMIQSALLVAQEILRKDIQIEPQLVHFEAEQPSVLNAVIFGHSITLTPGTITLDLRGDRYLVHALTCETAQEVLDGGMSQRVAKLSCDETVASPRPLPESEIARTWN